MFYGVYDNGKPASEKGFPNLKGKGCWTNHTFLTFEGAQEYARAWLGQFAPSPEFLKINQPYDYSGYGDVIEIRSE